MKVFKIAGIVLSLILVLSLAGGIYVKTALPDVGPAPQLTIEKSSQRVERGRYLANHVAVCMDCRGGMEFMQPAGIVRTPNLTPDKETGIGSWSEAMFLSRFEAYSDANFVRQELSADELNTPMPWTMYAGMNTSDLKAIHAYLKSLKPVSHKVEQTVAAKL